ncbi:helix-turn-helix transcriptional regulator [Frondihabitans sp. VKM Ac-2883]|uniref:helix-turn-helix domain-containing protein n=1 Tax=Frondihabitans sp. VKM Ac-2883 TaxID=2783823 RepID=UPI00188A331C|nr:helix-turn-helix transcriptional regulator [Frondihabitans sp. VKM Ac-2883]
MITPIKQSRVSHSLSRNEVAARASMGARTLSRVEDGEMVVSPQVISRISLAIESLVREQLREAG